MRVFNSHAPFNCSFSSDVCCRRQEWKKRRSYAQQILEVEHGTFAPLVLSSSGGWGSSAKVAFKRLASLISEKYGQSYSSTISWIRCRISHSLIDSAVACLRAPRSSRHAPIREIDLADKPPHLFLAEVKSVEYTYYYDVFDLHYLLILRTHNLYTWQCRCVPLLFLFHESCVLKVPYARTHAHIRTQTASTSKHSKQKWSSMHENS